jgi:isochorismate synthase
VVATGVAATVVPHAWTGEDVARAADEVMRASIEGHDDAPAMVVGAIPFDTRRPGFLYRPAEAVVEQTPNPEPVVDPTGRLEVVEQSPDPDGYRGIVRQAIRTIRSGAMDKVVLGRCTTVATSKAWRPEEVLAQLRAGNPDAYVFRLDLDGGMGGLFDQPGVLLGASPELVLSCADSRVRTLPLAGTIARGTDPVSDARAAEALLSSGKDLAEHAHVSRAVVEALGHHVDDIELPSSPQLVATPVVWHLGTPVEGLLRKGRSPLELLYDLHPTPAVCGWPSASARDFIIRHERFDRGLFAGLIGWMGVSGDCEWALVLRAGMLRADRATMFAGAGIVAASDPASELRETATKMTTFTAALGRVADPLAAGLRPPDLPTANAVGRPTPPIKE